MWCFKNVISSFRLVCGTNISVNASLPCVKNEAYLAHTTLDQNSTFYAKKTSKIMQISFNSYEKHFIFEALQFRDPYKETGFSPQQHPRFDKTFFANEF